MGNTGITEADCLNMDIIDSLIDPCLKKALAKVKDAKFTDTISKIINLLNGNAKIKVNVIDSAHLYSKGVEVDGKFSNASLENGVFSGDLKLK